jgi:hypothetical protein
VHEPYTRVHAAPLWKLVILTFTLLVGSIYRIRLGVAELPGLNLCEHDIAKSPNFTEGLALTGYLTYGTKVDSSYLDFEACAEV